MAWNMRTAVPEDLEALAILEAACFPPAEAAGKDALRERLSVYPRHFRVLEQDGRIVSMVNGLVTDLPKLTDEMYENTDMHDEKGAWQMIFGVDTHPEYRKQGCASRTLKCFIDDARRQNRKGVVLTCKEQLIHYYARFGFRNEGVSQSIHGGVVWYDMRLTF